MRQIDNWMDLFRYNLKNGILLADDYQSMRPSDLIMPPSRLEADRKHSLAKETNSELRPFFDGRYSTFRLDGLHNLDATVKGRKHTTWIGPLMDNFRLRDERDILRLEMTLKAVLIKEIDSEFSSEVRVEYTNVMDRCIVLLSHTLTNTVKRCGDLWWKQG